MKFLASITLVLVGGFLLHPQSVFAAAIAGDDIRCEQFSSIYHLGEDGKRHAYPNEAIYFTHNESFEHVKIVSCEKLGSIALGENVRYAGGKRLVKAPSVPTVYAIGVDGVLRALKSEAQAKKFYGSDWQNRVDDISEAFLSQYEIGDDYSDRYYLEGVVFANGQGDIYRANGKGTIIEIDDLLAGWQKTNFKKYALSLSDAESRIGKIPVISSSSRSSDDRALELKYLKKFLVKDGEATQSIEVTEATTTERQSDLAKKASNISTGTGSSKSGDSSTSTKTDAKTETSRSDVAGDTAKETTDESNAVGDVPTTAVGDTTSRTENEERTDSETGTGATPIAGETTEEDSDTKTGAEETGTGGTVVGDTGTGADATTDETSGGARVGVGTDEVGSGVGTITNGETGTGGTGAVVGDEEEDDSEEPFEGR